MECDLISTVTTFIRKYLKESIIEVNIPDYDDVPKHVKQFIFYVSHNTSLLPSFNLFLILSYHFFKPLAIFLQINVLESGGFII